VGIKRGCVGSLGAVLWVVVAGWLVGLPFVVWAWRDIGRIDPGRWNGLSIREAWLGGLVAGYVLGGWPAVVVAVAWRTSMTRDALLPFRTDRSSRR
jgi:hypothetical protein